MKATEYGRAIGAIDNALSIRYARSETAHRAIGATLALMGARRIHAAVGFNLVAGQDRTLLGLLSKIEHDAVRLSGIPCREEHADDRRACWSQICADLVIVRAMLTAAAAAQAAVEAAEEAAAQAG